MRVILNAALLALFAMMMGACRPHDTSAVSRVLKRGLSGEPASLDPSAAADNFSLEVERDLFEGLTAEAADGTIVPGVASSWTVDTSGTTYVFVLRPDTRWSDGSVVTAQQFVDSWRRVIDPTSASPSADLLRVIAGAPDILTGKAAPATLHAIAVSPTELRVELDRPAPYFPALLSHPATAPLRDITQARTHDPEHWVSNGPYVLASWSPGTTVRLTQNPAYWDRAHVHIASVDYRIAPDDTTQLRRYEADELDITDTVPANAISQIQRDHASELQLSPILTTAYYGLNLASDAFKSNVKLRQALAMAIDRRQVVRLLGLSQRPAFALVPLGTVNYTPQEWPWAHLSDEERIAQARALFAAAGYSISQPLTLHVLYSANPGIRQTAIAVAAMWKSTLGIECELHEEEYRVFLESRHDRHQWDVARFSWGADYNDAASFLDALRARSENNDMAYDDPDYDHLLEEAAHTADPQMRRVKLQDSERRLLAAYPVIPLYQFVSKRLIKPYVTGFRPNPLNHLASKSLLVSDRPGPPSP